MKYLWDTEHPGGHAQFCVHPRHSLIHYCSADESEPQTLRGEPSSAWQADHSDAITTASMAPGERAAWQVSISRGMNISRLDVRLMLQAADAADAEHIREENTR